MSNSQKIDYVKKYFQNKYNVDISPVINTEIVNLKNQDINSMPIYENINIEGFVNDASQNFSEYFRAQISDILKKISLADNDTTKMKQILNDYFLIAEKSNNFEQNEKEYFVNMLYVFDSSITYWYNYDFETKTPKPADMWKIPAADWTGGIIGLLGGPGGAVIGYLGSSAGMAIGLW